MIVGGVQGGCGRAGHPGAIGTGLRMTDFLLQHRVHEVGHGPHALADLRPSGQPAQQTDVNVPVLIGTDPGLRAHLRLAHHRTGFHRGVDLIASAIQEAGVDEGHPMPGCADAFLEVDRGAALFVHDADLHGVGRQPERLLDLGEHRIREGDFFRPVHLGLDDVDRTTDRIAYAGLPAQVVHGNQHGAHGIEQAFEDFLAIAIEDGRVGHQVADIAHQHQGAALEGERSAVRCEVLTVGGESALERTTALGDGLDQ